MWGVLKGHFISKLKTYLRVFIYWQYSCQSFKFCYVLFEFSKIYIHKKYKLKPALSQCKASCWNNIVDSAAYILTFTIVSTYSNTINDIFY